MEQTVEVLTGRLEKAKQVFKQMKAEASEKDDVIANMTQQIEDYKAQLGQTLDKDIIIEGLKEQVNELSNKIESCNIELSKSKESIKQRDETINNITKEKDEFETSAKRYYSELAKTADELKVLKTEADNHAKETDNNLNTLKANIEEITTKYKELANKYNDVIDENIKLQETYDALAHELKVTQEKLEETNTSNTQLKDNYETLKQTAKEYHESVQKREEIINKTVESFTTSVKNLPGLHDFNITI